MIIQTPGFETTLRSTAKAACEVVAQQIMDDCLNLVPKDTNTLRSSARKEEIHDGWRIVWDMPYAEYQYTHELNHTTPGTTDHWVEKAEKNRGKDWQQVFENALRKFG